MSDRKTICIIGPCLKMGGIERASSNVANGLDDLGYRVIYLAIFRQEKFFTLNKDVLFDEPLAGQNTNKLAIWPTITRIRKKIKEYNPDGILVYNKFYAALVGLALWGTGYSYFLSERSSPFYKWARKIKLINRVAFTLNPPAGVLAQTKQAAEFQRKYYGPKPAIEVIPNSLSSTSKANPNLESKQILAVGRLNDHLKGFDRLIRAMQFVAADWRLAIVGADSKKGPLNDLITELNLGHRISLEPKASDLTEYYNSSSIYVIPSRSEGFPNALIEAMAAGLPPVSFNFIAGPAEIITDGQNGLLVPEGDIEGLAAAINKLAADLNERKRIAANAKEAEKDYSNDRICSRIAQFLNL